MPARRHQTPAILACLGFAVTLAACAVNPGPLNPEVTSGIKRIGAVSLIQDRLSGLRSPGQSTEADADYVTDVPDWALQAKSEETILAALVKSGRFEVVPLSYDAVALWREYDAKQNDLFDYGAVWTGLLPSLQPSIAGKNLDAVLVALPGYLGRNCQQRAYCDGYGQFGFGVAITQTGPFGRSFYMTYISVDLLLLDAVSGKPLGSIEVNEHKTIKLMTLDDDVLDLNAANFVIMRDSIYEQLMPYIPAGLNRMRLTR